MKRYFIITTIAVVILISGCSNNNGINQNFQEGAMKTVNDANKQLESTVPSNLKKCTTEMFSTAICDDVPDAAVCGYDHTTPSNGTEKDHAITYRNSCTYCRMFKEDGTMIMGTVKSLGYLDGECSTK